MIGLDINAVVRYIAQDDDMQSAKATQLIESLSVENSGFITLVSVLGLVWVMQGCYKATKQGCVAILQTLLHTREILLENAEIIVMATHKYSASNADFADCLIERSANYAKCTSTMTFDSNVAKSAGIQLIE